MLKTHLQYILEPDGAPQNITAVNKTSTSILVTWDEVPNDRRHGLILNYEVGWTSTASYVTNSKEVQASTQYLEITGLEQNTNYTITVMASTSKGYGPASEPIFVATDQDSKYTSALTCINACTGKVIDSSPKWRPKIQINQNKKSIPALERPPQL